MKRFFFALVVPFFLIAEPLKVDLSAECAILINAETGAILFEKNASRPYNPASITKIATALYVLEKKGNALGELATATQECLAIVPKHMRISQPCLLQADGTSMGLRVGEVISLKSLLYGLMICSGNDAANVLARYFSGSLDQFVVELNQFLREKGIRHTNFLNPHGLHHPDHRTTAYDMAQITKEAFKYPLFREIVKTVKYTRQPSNKQQGAELVQHNKLLRRGKYYYPKAVGVKTGYTTRSGFTISAAAEHEGRRLIAVLLGCPTVDQRYGDAIKLFEAAFGEKLQSRTFFNKQHDHFWLELKKGKTSLEAALDEDLSMDYYPAEEPKVKAQLKWDMVKLPIRAGQLVGHLELITDQGQCVKSAPLFAVKGVEQTFWVAYKTILVPFALCLFVMAALFYLLKKPKKIT